MSRVKNVLTTMSRVKRNILLNPGPVTTTDTIKQSLIVPDICHREHEFTDLIQSIRQDSLKVVNAGDDFTTILFTASGTGAVESCISSVVQKSKKIAIINNGSYGQRMINIATRYDIDTVEIQSSWGQPLDLTQIEATLANDKQIACLAMVHHETSNGSLNPLREVGDICQRLNKLYIVDAMSSYAGTEIDVNQDQIDFLMASSNKCLHGMPGMSFMIARTQSLLDTEGNARSFYLDAHQQYHDLEKGGAMPFTPAVQVAYAFRCALDELFAETLTQRIQRYRDNYLTLKTGLQQLGFDCITPEINSSQLLMIVKAPDYLSFNFDHMHDYLYARGFTIYPQKLPIENTFRLACIGDLFRDDIQAFLNVLRQYIQTQAPQSIISAVI